MQRVRRKLQNKQTLYAWRCARARKRSCDQPRIWTDDQGNAVNRPPYRIRPSHTIGVSRPICDRCGKAMHSLGKQKNALFGSLWKWRCSGTLVNPHKSYEIWFDYWGNRLQLPRSRRWGKKLLPFELERLKELPAKCGPERRLAVIEKCHSCRQPLMASQRGPRCWRLRCPSGCTEPYFVNQEGERQGLTKLGPVSKMVILCHPLGYGFAAP